MTRSTPDCAFRVNINYLFGQQVPVPTMRSLQTPLLHRFRVGAEASFLDAIEHVVLPGTYREMIRIDAAFDVTSVQRIHSLRYGNAFEMLQGKMMRQHRSFFAYTFRYMAITGRRNAASP